MDVTDLQRQRALSDRDLQIFNAELERQRRNLGIAYLLWFLPGWAGAHKPYLGKWGVGVLYLILGLGSVTLLWGTFIGAMLSADTSAGSPSAAATAFGAAAILGIISIIVLDLLWLWDLFTLPMQVNRREAKIQRTLLARLQAPA